MRIVNIDQGSEAWEKLRCGIPTASNFGKVVTPARGQLASGWRSYAAELIAAELGVSVPPPPSFWMQHGTENEPYAVEAYKKIKNFTDKDLIAVGFVWPDDHARYGCSPDRLIGDDGLLEIKCPKPETLIEYHLSKSLPNEYKPQVFGQLLITGRKWCDFMGYHPELAPFILRVERDEEYIEKLAESLDEFCRHLDEIREQLAGIDEAVDVQIDQEYVDVNYQPSEIEL